MLETGPSVQLCLALPSTSAELRLLQPCGTQPRLPLLTGFPGRRGDPLRFKSFSCDRVFSFYRLALGWLGLQNPFH